MDQGGSGGGMEGQAREEDEGLDHGAEGRGAVVDLGSGAVAVLGHGTLDETMEDQVAMVE